MTTSVAQKIFADRVNRIEVSATMAVTAEAAKLRALQIRYDPSKMILTGVDDKGDVLGTDGQAVALWVARRWGDAFGGWLAGLPVTAAPVAAFLAIEHGPAFAAAASAGSVAAVASQASFFMAYTAASGRGWKAAALAVEANLFHGQIARQSSQP